MIRMTRIHTPQLLAAFVLIAVATVTSSASAQSIFKDENLEAAVREQVHDKRDSDEPLTADDVQNVATVDASDRGITDLTGLEHCRSLAALSLAGNDVEDLTPLAELSRLQTLDLADNRVTDVAPLKNLKALQRLDLSGNQVQNVEPLAGLERMRSLCLSDNAIEDPTPLAKLNRVWSLYLDGNPVQNWDLLAELDHLQTLDVSDTGLSDAEVLVAPLPSLRLLIADNNELSDVSPLVNAIEQDANGDRAFAPFLRVYLRENPLSDTAREQIATAQENNARITIE